MPRGFSRRHLARICPALCGVLRGMCGAECPPPASVAFRAGPLREAKRIVPGDEAFVGRNGHALCTRSLAIRAVLCLAARAGRREALCGRSLQQGVLIASVERGGGQMAYSLAAALPLLPRTEWLRSGSTNITHIQLKKSCFGECACILLLCPLTFVCSFAFRWSAATVPVARHEGFFAPILRPRFRALPARALVRRRAVSMC